MIQNAQLKWRMPDSLVQARRSADRLSPDPGAMLQIDGCMHRTMEFVKEKQLYSAEHWHRFVSQFYMDADGANKGWRGEYWGKMMRGACFVYEVCPDEKLYDILQTSVSEMIHAADASGRISSYGKDREFDGWDMWCRKYVMLGMEYFWEICKDENLKKSIVTSLCRQADAILAHIGPAEEGKIPVTKATRNWRGLNSVSILEPMVRLYHLTGQQKYLDFSAYLVSTGGCEAGNLFEMAEQDILYPYQYPVTKAYEMMSCFEGLLEYARVTQNKQQMDAVIRFAHKIIESDITIIGSSGCTHELFDHSLYRQTCTDYQGIMQETCVTVTWMKFCTQLLYLTGDVTFADQIEQSMYNAYMGSLNTEGKVPGGLPFDTHPQLVKEILPFDSYSPLVPGTRGRKVGGFQIMSDNTYYGCCACIASAGIGMVSRAMIMRDDKGIYLNLFEKGTIRTQAPDLSPLEINIDTNYPVNGTLNLTLKGDCHSDFGLYLRIPSWSQQTIVTVDGHPVEAACGTYLYIPRCFDGRHEVQVCFDMRVFVIHPFGVGFGKDILHTNIDWKNDMVIPEEYTEDPQSRYHIAFRCGPLKLASDARLGRPADSPVFPLVDENGTVQALQKPADSVSYPCLTVYDIKQTDGTYFRVTDYASAGKTWDKSSECAIWLPISPSNV